MNTRSILIGTCLVATLTGLGYLAWYVYGDTEDTDSRADLPDKKQTPHGYSNYNRAGQKPPERANQPSTRQRSQPQTNAKAQQTTIPETEFVPPQGDEFPLRLGSKGKRVERLQVWLMRNYGWTGKITDVFDKKTESLLKRFLKKTQLDQATYNRMKMGSPLHRQPVIR